MLPRDQGLIINKEIKLTQLQKEKKGDSGGACRKMGEVREKVSEMEKWETGGWFVENGVDVTSLAMATVTAVGRLMGLWETKDKINKKRKEE